MQTDNAPPRKSIFRRRNIIIAVVLVVLVVVAIFAFTSTPQPVAPDQKALDDTITYFASAYNEKVGLVATTEGGSVFLLYPDNYLASLAISKYSSSDLNVTNFAADLHYLITGYTSAIASNDTGSVFEVLNSTSFYFGCPLNYTLGWYESNGSRAQTGSLRIETTSNVPANGGRLGPFSVCFLSLQTSTGLFLDAIHAHQLGNATAAVALYDRGAAYFDGTGFADWYYTNSSSPTYHVYQTSDLALYVYSTICLGQQQTATGLASAESIMLGRQSNSTGGFSSGYTSSTSAVTGTGNTEATALAALALELMINPSGSC